MLKFPSEHLGLWNFMITVSHGEPGLARIESGGILMGFYSAVCFVSKAEEIFLRELIEHMIQTLWSQDWVSSEA